MARRGRVRGGSGLELWTCGGVLSCSILATFTSFERHWDGQKLEDYCGFLGLHGLSMPVRGIHHLFMLHLSRIPFFTVYYDMYD